MTCRPFLKPIRLAGALLALSTTLSLTACGGGGDASSTDFSSTKVSGTVIDGPIRGATVFLDLNENFAHDSGEPISAPSAADGAFSLVTGDLTAAQLASALFVTHVPDSAFDSDDAGLSLAQAGRRGFTLASPARAYLSAGDGASSAAPALLSPLTTLVAAEMAFNGLSIAAAKAKVQQLAATGAKDPMTNFIATGDQALGDTARTMAIALGELAKTISESAQAGGGLSHRDLVARTIDALRAALPSLLAQVDTSGPAPVPVASVTANL